MKQELLKQIYTSHWYRVRRRGQWLHMSGEGWIDSKSYSYLATTKGVTNLMKVSQTLADYDDWWVEDVTKEVRGRRR